MKVRTHHNHDPSGAITTKTKWLLYAGNPQLVTCRLHDIDPYDHFVDMLQRVGQHPASQVHQLTPRLWKSLFAANPLRSDLYGLRS